MFLDAILKTETHGRFFACFPASKGGGSSKNPRIPRTQTNKRRFGGLCRGEMVPKLRGFTLKLRGFVFFSAHPFFSFCSTFTLIYIYISFKKKEIEREARTNRGKNRGIGVRGFLKKMRGGARFFLPARAIPRTPMENIYQRYQPLIKSNGYYLTNTGVRGLNSPPAPSGGKKMTHTINLQMGVFR